MILKCNGGYKLWINKKKNIKFYYNNQATSCLNCKMNSLFNSGWYLYINTRMYKNLYEVTFLQTPDTIENKTLNKRIKFKQLLLWNPQ